MLYFQYTSGVKCHGEHLLHLASDFVSDNFVGIPCVPKKGEIE